MKNYTKHEVSKLQDNLLLIHKAGRWLAEESGEFIGVTKQTISNLENKKTALSKTQYIAIRGGLAALVGAAGTWLAAIIKRKNRKGKENEQFRVVSDNDNFIEKGWWAF